MKKFYRLLVLTGCVAGISACTTSTSNLLPDKAVDYQRSAQAKRDLSVPPNLSSNRIGDLMSVPNAPSGGSANYSQYEASLRQNGANSGQPAVLPPHPGIKVISDGTNRWLQVDAGADAVWDRVLAFWQNQGVPLVQEDPKLGIMRTAWLENKANLPQDFITRTLSKMVNGLYETGERDSYRVRLEREPNGKTDIFLTQYSMQEVLDHGIGGEAQQPVWVPKPRDPAVEAVMLQRLMVYLGDSEKRAQASISSPQQYQNQPRAQLVQTASGTPELIVAQDFPRAWNLVGLLLDRVGFAVDDRDRSKGIYYVSYNDPDAQQSSGGFLSTLAFWKSKPKPEDKYQIHLSQTGQNTVVQVYNNQGQLASGETPKRILSLLHEQFH